MKFTFPETCLTIDLIKTPFSELKKGDVVIDRKTGTPAAFVRWEDSAKTPEGHRVAVFSVMFREIQKISARENLPCYVSA